MKLKSLLLILIVLILLLLTGCGGECKRDTDCSKPHFTGTCVKKECNYTPIPNEIGNEICEPAMNENKCTAPVDCGICQGSNGPYLKYSCLNNNCVDSVPSNIVKPVYLSSEAKVSGLTFKTTSDFNQPFNLKGDLFKLEFSLMSIPPTVEDVTLKRIELTGITQDRRTVTLHDDTLNRPLHLDLDVVKELILRLTTADNYGELINLNLKVYYDYAYVYSGKKTIKSASFVSRFSGLKSFVWVMPEAEYVCPASCDDDNLGTEDLCSEQTNFFCIHNPISGVCGNYVCESSENKCTCDFDCGKCSGNAGNYMQYVCYNDECLAELKQSFSQDKKKIFDDRSFAKFHLQNNYEFNDPFNVNSDKVDLSFSVYQKNEEVSAIRITDLRLFEGSVEVAYEKTTLSLSSVGDVAQFSLPISDISGVEQSKTLSLAVWYEVDIGGETTKNDYRKPLGSFTLVNPGK